MYLASRSTKLLFYFRLQCLIQADPMLGLPQNKSKAFKPWRNFTEVIKRKLVHCYSIYCVLFIPSHIFVSGIKWKFGAMMGEALRNPLVKIFCHWWVPPHHSPNPYKWMRHCWEARCQLLQQLGGLWKSMCKTEVMFALHTRNIITHQEFSNTTSIFKSGIWLSL